MKQILTVFFLLLYVSVFAQQNISTSLHYTRAGKNTAYRSEHGGMQLITNIPMS
jgi:hypothetical protein